MDWKHCELPSTFGLDGIAFRSGGTVVATRHDGHRLCWQLFWDQADGTMRPGSRGGFDSSPEAFSQDAILKQLYGV